MRAKLRAHKKKISIVSAILLGSLFLITLVTLFRRATVASPTLIAQDLKLLSGIFDKIEADCGILSFDAQKNVINFLNVGSFAGSEVGPLNLRYPQNWKGPYLQDNPMAQGIEYQIVGTVKGYFITPGDGVKLPNGKIVGTDIKLNNHADIESMMQKGGDLFYDNTSLAVPVRLLPSYDFLVEEDY